MAEFLFVAEFQRGKAALCKVEIIKETAKTFVIKGRYGERTPLIGKMFPPRERLLKSDHNFRGFKSCDDALAYLVARAEGYVATCQEKLAKAQEQWADLGDWSPPFVA